MTKNKYGAPDPWCADLSDGTITRLRDYAYTLEQKSNDRDITDYQTPKLTAFREALILLKAAFPEIEED